MDHGPIHFTLVSPREISNCGFQMPFRLRPTLLWPPVMLAGVKVYDEDHATPLA